MGSGGGHPRRPRTPTWVDYVPGSRMGDGKFKWAMENAPSPTPPTPSIGHLRPPPVTQSRMSLHKRSMHSLGPEGSRLRLPWYSNKGQEPSRRSGRVTSVLNWANHPPLAYYTPLPASPPLLLVTDVNPTLMMRAGSSPTCRGGRNTLQQPQTHRSPSRLQRS